MAGNRSGEGSNRRVLPPLHAHQHVVADPRRARHLPGAGAVASAPPGRLAPVRPYESPRWDGSHRGSRNPEGPHLDEEHHADQPVEMVALPQGTDVDRVELHASGQVGHDPLCVVVVVPGEQTDRAMPSTAPEGSEGSSWASRSWPPGWLALREEGCRRSWDGWG